MLSVFLLLIRFISNSTLGSSVRTKKRLQSYVVPVVLRIHGDFVIDTMTSTFHYDAVAGSPGRPGDKYMSLKGLL
jgi:hypothetical protein